MSATFTDDEIETLRKGAMGAGLLVSTSDRGFFDTFKEAGALSKHVAAAHEHSDSAPPADEFKDQALLEWAFGSTWRIALDSLRSGVELLKAKAPDELEAYRSFVLELARSVAAAAPGGDEAEAAAIAKIEPALA